MKNKHNVYIVIVIIMTITCVTVMMSFRDKGNSFTSRTQQNNDIQVYNQDDGISDLVLDTFIKNYAKEFNEIENFEIKVEGREDVRSLIHSMGNINVQKLKEVIHSGNKDEVAFEVKKFVNDNFMWEEKTIMEQYINVDK